MKRIKKVLSLITYILLINLYSCSTTDENVEIVYDSNVIQMELNKPIVFNDYMIMERIGKNHNISKELLKNIDYEFKDLDLDNIVRVNYGWTEHFVFEIPFKGTNNKQRLSIFKIGKEYLTTFVEIKDVNNRVKTVEVSSFDLQQLLYSFDMVDEKEISNFIGISFEENQNQTNEHKYDKDEDCGKYKFVECMQCGIDVCAQDWRCQIASIAVGPAFAAGLAITCGIRSALNSLK